MTLAATGDTWGIPGPTFLTYFITALIVVAVAAAIHRRILFHGNAGTDASRLGPQQVAYLNGRDKLAVYTSISGLRAAGSIGSGPDKTLVQTGPLPSGVTPLDSAVCNAAGRRIRARDITGDPYVVQAVGSLREGLETAGLAVSKGRQRTARLWAVAGAVLVLIGAARLVDGIQNDKPIGYLIPLTFVALIIAIFALVRGNRSQTHAADKAMRALRKQHTYLAPNQSPAYATYGAAGAAMGVALFGAASLYAMDPAFAAEAEIQRISAGTPGSSYSGDSGSGSSCSGGSSCGGGGGCGGGGCGG